MFEAPTPDPATLASLAGAKPRSGLPRGYVAGWVIAACMALGYTGEIVLGTVNLPGLLARPGTRVTAAPAEVAAVIEAKRLREALAEFQHDVSLARRELEARAFDSAVVATLTAVEERMSITTGIAPALPAAKMTAIEPSAASVLPSTAVVSAVPAIPVAVAVAVTPVTAPGPVARPASDAGRFAVALPNAGAATAPLETGSITRPSKLTGQLPKGNVNGTTPGSTLGGQALVQPTPMVAVERTTSEPIAFGPAVVKAAPQPFGVQLASGPSLDAIKLSWSLLADQHGDALGRLQPHFTATGTPTSGQTFDLVAGPIKSIGDAKKICKALAARGTDCKVTSSLGETF